MADPTPAPTSGDGKASSFGFLGRKIGPVPIWLIAVAGFGAYYWWTHYGPGKPAPVAQGAAGGGLKVIEVRGQRGRPGPPGPAAGGGHGRPKPPTRPGGPKGGPPTRRPATGPGRGAQPPASQPVTAAAPMTAGDVYGAAPTAMMDGSTYDSGYPAAAAMEGAYVPAG